MTSLATATEVAEVSDAAKGPSDVFSTRLNDVRASLNRVNKAAEVSADEINNSLEVYAQATKAGKEMERIAERPGFDIMSKISFSSIFVYFFLFLIIGGAVLVMMHNSEEEWKERTGLVVGLLGGGLFLMIILFVVHSMLYGIAHKDLTSHGEFVQYVIGKTVMDRLYAVKDLRQYISEFEAQIGTSSTAAETAKERISRFIRNVALNRPVELFGLSKVKEEVDSTRSWGKAVFFIVLFLLVGGIALLISSLVFTVQGTFVTESLLNTSIISTNEGKTWEQVKGEAGWTARAGHAVVGVSASEVLVIGGAKDLSDVWQGTYNAESKGFGKTWKQLTASAAFGSRSGHAVVRQVIAEAESDTAEVSKLILVGGRDFSDGKAREDVYESDNGGRKWTKITHEGNFGARRGHSLLFVPDAARPPPSSDPASAPASAGGEESGQGQEIQESKDITASSAAAAHKPGDAILVFGGSDSNEAWESLDQGKKWTMISEDIKGARRFHSAGVLGNRIVAFGGVKGNDVTDEVVMSVNGGRTWVVAEVKEGSPKPGARFGAASYVVPGAQASLVIVGGKNDKAILQDVWQLTIDAEGKANWSRLAESVADDANRAFGGAVRLGSHAMVLGGERSIEAAKKKGVAGVDVKRTEEATSQIPIGMIAAVGIIVLVVGILYTVMHNKFYKVMYKEVPEMYVVTNREWVKTLEDIGKSPEKYDSGVTPDAEAARTVARSVASKRAKSLTPDELARRQQQTLARSMTPQTQQPQQGSLL